MPRVFHRINIILLFICAFARGVPRYTSVSLPDHSFTYQSPIKNDLSDDISFCIVDLKYDGTRIAICELGNGLQSQFKGYDHFFHPGRQWACFWNFLNSFNLPIWYCDKYAHQGRYAERALKTLSQYGGHIKQKISYFEQDKTFQKTIRTNKQKQVGIQHYAGIAAFSNQDLLSNPLNNFLKKYHNILVVGRYTNESVCNKQKTSDLFDACNLSSYRPKHVLVNKEYTPELAQNIIQFLNCDLFVIKPVNASVGRGVIMTDKNNFDRILKLITIQHNVIKTTKSLQTDPSYSYWLHDKNNNFLVEELVQSKLLYVDGKPYNPTMRIIFVLVNDAGSLSITFFDGYWKLPANQMDGDSSLTEKYKSKIALNHECSALVSTEDFNAVTNQLCIILPQLYLQMLAQSSPQSLN